MEERHTNRLPMQPYHNQVFSGFYPNVVHTFQILAVFHLRPVTVRTSSSSLHEVSWVREGTPVNQPRRCFLHLPMAPFRGILEPACLRMESFENMHPSNSLPFTFPFCGNCRHFIIVNTFAETLFSPYSIKFSIIKLPDFMQCVPLFLLFTLIQVFHNLGIYLINIT